MTPERIAELRKHLEDIAHNHHWSNDEVIIDECLDEIERLQESNGKLIYRLTTAATVLPDLTWKAERDAAIARVAELGEELGRLLLIGAKPPRQK